jgi:subtilase family serine protease
MRRFRFLTCAIATGLLTLLVNQNLSAAEMLHAKSRASATQTINFEVYLRTRNQTELDQLLTAQHTPGNALYRKWITPQEFKARFGPRPEDVARLTDVLKSYGLSVTGVHSHGLHVQGPVKAAENAFGVALSNTTTAGGHSRIMASGTLTLPAALREVGAQITGFAPAIRARVHSRRMPGAVPDNRLSPDGGYWFDDLKQAYEFPSFKKLSGKGRTVAIVIPSDFKDKDIKAYFKHEKLAPPNVIRRPLQGGSKFDPNSGASLEAELDIEQVGGMAPNATIIVYNLADFSDDSIIGGYTQIVEDNVADIVNSSFGESEVFFTAEYNDGTDFTGILQVYEDIFKQGNSQGITFVASSGDNGALDAPALSYFTDPPTDPPHVAGTYVQTIENPASSPSVTAVGGTNLVTTFNPPSLESNYVSENADDDPLIDEDPFGTGNLVTGGVWAGGGGPSLFFSRPAYQLLVKTGSKKRTIPDISGHMGGCPNDAIQPCGPHRSFVIEAFDGDFVGVIGTSAASPDFAGILALKEENLGGIRLGNENFDIYALAAAQQLLGSAFKIYRQNIDGFNGVFSTNRGYDQVLGNGTPIVKNFVLAPNAPSAGDPQTPSNP